MHGRIGTSLAVIQSSQRVATLLSLTFTDADGSRAELSYRTQSDGVVGVRYALYRVPGLVVKEFQPGVTCVAEKRKVHFGEGRMDRRLGMPRVRTLSRVLMWRLRYVRILICVWIIPANRNAIFQLTLPGLSDKSVC